MDANDHRAIANRLDLFHQQEEGPGVIFWHPRGFAVYRIIEDYIRRRMRSAGFREVRTPQMLSRALWERSGHWQKFSEGMFSLDNNGRALALKPMNCPGHIQIFNERLRSFRELPIRYFEFGACHRNEPSGSLLGLMRARAFTQDDAHIFCAEQHVEAEVARFYDLLRSIYADFGFADFVVNFSTRPAVRAGSDEVWDRAEELLSAVAQSVGMDYKIQPGEGAFYGPKLEFVLSDNKGREWQCGTVQIDYVLPERFNLSYVDAGNMQCQPVMLHHAVLGSLERFIGMLLEHYQGNLPFWLAPDQIVVASIGEAQAAYAERVAAELEGHGYRVVVDISSERLPKKIVDAREAGIPILMAVGKREEKNGTLSLRHRSGEQEVLSISEAINSLEQLKMF